MLRFLSPKILTPFAAALLLAAQAHAVNFAGAGSSAAAPIYLKWAEGYSKKLGNALDYQSVGSSAGIKQIKARSVDFGASDVALPPAELKQEKLIQFPAAISGVVPVYNLPGVRAGELKLSGEVLADMFARKITHWNDAAIAALNPSLHLPAKNIEVVARSDGSGTTYNFTDYLSKVNPSWQAAFGKNFTIKWHADVTQAKGSGGISAAVRKTPYALGYIDFNYVVQDKLDYALMKNHDGKFLAPSAEAFAAAMANSEWKTKASFEEMLTDKVGPTSWPITMGTFVIVPQVAKNPEKTIAALKFFTWGFMYGDQMVNSLDLVRLPDAVQARVFREMMTVVDVQGKPLQWTLQ